MLSDQRILHELHRGNIVIEPFDRASLGTNSYDVRLGEWYFSPTYWSSDFPRWIDITEEQLVRAYWGEPHQAPVHSNGRRYLAIPAGDTYLCHTQEVIGGRNGITSEMRARSSIGRCGISVCKCLVPDTLVRMADGTTKSIENIRVGDEVINVGRNSIDRPAKVRAVATSAAMPTLVIKTRGGRTVTCSPDHLFRVSRTYGAGVVKAEYLQSGDALPVLARWFPEVTHDLTEDAAALLGYLVAEGHFAPYFVSVAKAEDKASQRDEVKRLMSSVFPDAPVPKEYTDDLRYQSKAWVDEVKRQFPEICRLSPDKRVPRALFTAPLPVVWAFLRTYLQCDGSLSKPTEVTVTSRSAGLVSDIALLAARLGSVGTFSTRKTAAGQPVGLATFYGESAAALRGQDIVPQSGKVFETCVSDLMKKIRKDWRLTRAEMSGYDTTSHKGISRRKLEEIDSRIGDDDRLIPYTGSLAWDSIKSVTPGLIHPRMVDIALEVECEEDSLFVLGNGLMALNCAGIGDVGYISRWTMEVTNHSAATVVIPVGLRVAQILFHEVGETLKSYSGKYGSWSTDRPFGDDWDPEDMLPKLWRDKD